MKKVVILLLFSVFVFPWRLHSTILKKGPVTVEGYVKAEVGVSGDLSRLIKEMNILDIKTQFRPKPCFSFFLHIHKYQDLAYNRDEYSPSRHRMISNREPFEGISWVREAYIDIFTDLVDVRLGKQIVTWGTSDGIRVLDAFINPLDWREFTLKPWNEIKVPLWMLKIEIAPTLNGSLQLLFIPDFERDYYAGPHSPYAFRVTNVEYRNYQVLRRLGYRVDVDRDEPAQNIRDAKYGIRWRDVIGDFEYTLNFLYGWDTGATINTTDVIVPFPPPGPPPVPGFPPIGSTFRIKKKYSRIRVWGGSFSKTFTSGFLKGLTLRGEFAYVNDKVVTYMGDDAKPHQTKIDTYNYVIGLDKYLITNWLFSFQFIQKILSKKDYHGKRFLLPSGGKMRKVSTYLTLKVSTDFFHERLKPNVLILYGDQNDWRISPEFPIEWGDHITTNFGAHILEGRRKSVFGEFKDQKQIFFEFRYSF